MTVEYKDYSIDIIDDQFYSIGSADNTSHYHNTYFNGSINQDRYYYPTSKHGIRVRQSGKEISSAIVCEVGAATTIHEKSFLIVDNSIYLCCADKVYSFNISDLSLRWSKKVDHSTCLGIYAFFSDLVIHGELAITLIDRNGNIKWEFSARDIFVTQDNSDSIIIKGDKIELKDWEGFKYTLDKNGVELN